MSISVKLPKNLPNVDVNNPVFESGFDEEFIETLLPHNIVICGICQGLPRRPASLAQCGHLFCELCLKRLIDEFMKTHLRYEVIPCPLCRIPFPVYGILTFGQFQFWSQALYKAIQVKCPSGCGFKGNAIDVDNHQVFLCPKRRIKCPNETCQIIMPACDMEERHLQDCPLLLMTCPGCLLTVKKSELTKHNCQQKLAEAVTSMNLFSFIFEYEARWCKWKHIRVKPGRLGFESPLSQNNFFLNLIYIKPGL